MSMYEETNTMTEVDQTENLGEDYEPLPPIPAPEKTYTKSDVRKVAIITGGVALVAGAGIGVAAERKARPLWEEHKANLKAKKQARKEAKAAAKEARKLGKTAEEE